MAIENFNEIVEYINTNGENEEVKNYLQGFKKTPTVEEFKTLAETDENFKGYINSIKDSHFSKSLETWKTNNLPKLVDAEILKRNPKLDPKDLEMDNLRKEIEAIKSEKQRAEMTAKYKDVMNEKKIPSSLTNFLLADDEEMVNTNISLFEESMQSYINAMVEERLKQGSYTPPKTNNNPTLITQEEWDRNKNDLDWYQSNREKIFESQKQGLIR